MNGRENKVFTIFVRDLCTRYIFVVASLIAVNQPVRAEDIVKEAISNIKFNYEWHTGGFDSILLLSMTLINNGKSVIKDFEVSCEFVANSGTVIDRNVRIVYEKVAPGKKKKIRDFNMGFLHSQAKRGRCEITDLKVE